MNRRRILAAGTGVVLAGCISYPSSDESPSGAEIVRDAVDARRHMSALRARRSVTIETPAETDTRTERIAREPPAKQRIEVLESTDDDVPVGSVSVTNRAQTWEYNPSTGIVELQFHGTKTDTDRTLRVLEALLEEYRLGYAGTEPVDGREAHVIETRPPLEDERTSIDLVVGDTTYSVPVSAAKLGELDVSRTIWIDDETRYPIKERNAVSDDGETLYAQTVTYEEFAIDDGIDPETFTYQPPADAEVVSDGSKPAGIFRSRDAAADTVPYDLPDPDLPGSYVLDRITVVERKERYGGVTTTLWYDDPNVVARELFVVVREEGRFDPSLDSLERTEVDGQTTYFRDGGVKSFFWDCEDVSYEVSSLVTDDPLREITASIGCS
ncbi:DUF2092 domain-containing protein [Natrinema thermotolerans]|uniref:DUF2092 domain-containing protein n=1 Tax=Natrinema thermotolerans TaxID=121872 RepID=A0AAF0PGL6_9EURY|nr:hypothetical protein [Natrinema thermotolerans]QCC58005.1 DUF2092 domain-containing protein [Natrinema thermotolerans]WMT09099.1 DUF2092 domain-containing protein [Natrinema thermotolerans]